MISAAIDKVGKDGVITVEEGQTFGMEMDLVEGMRFDKGYLSPYMVTDTERMEATFDDPYLLFVSSKISCDPRPRAGPRDRDADRPRRSSSSPRTSTVKPSPRSW